MQHTPSAGKPQPCVDLLAIRVSKLKSVFDNAQHFRSLVNTHDSDVQSLLDAIQSISNNSGLDTAFKCQLVVATQRLSKKSGLYPVCFQLKDVTQISEEPVAGGGFGDIYKGRFQGQVVCIKVLRIYGSSRVEHTLKQLSKEAILWGQIIHLNILPFFGVYLFKNRPCLVAPWMDNGDISEYLEKNPDVSRPCLVDDIAQGLKYLHDNGIVHGDLKGPNILVDDVGRARVSDFGISSISDPKVVAWTSQSAAASKGGSVRWQAPELFDTDDGEPVKNSVASDVYAWGCVCYEVFTGTVPFFNIIRETIVVLQVQQGTRPVRPPATSPSWQEWGLTESIWSLLQDCWREAPEERPTIAEAIHRLGVDHIHDTRLGGSHLPTTPFREGMSEPLNETVMSTLDRILEKILGKDAAPNPNPSYMFYSVAFSPDGRYIISGSHDASVRLWDVKPAKPQLYLLKGHTSPVRSVAFSPDGNQVASGSEDATVRVWGFTKDREKLMKLRGHTSSVTSVAFSPDGLKIVSGSDDSFVRLWDARTGVCIWSIPKRYNSSVTSVAFSADSTKIALGSRRAFIQLLNVTTGNLIAELSVHTSSITSIAFSPNGTLIASGSDGCIRSWDCSKIDLSPPWQLMEKVLTDLVLGEIIGHTTSVNSIAFSPNGTRIASGSNDGYVRLWDSKSVSIQMRGQIFPVTSVTFSPDGSRIASSLNDGSVQVWDAITGESVSVLVA